MGPRPPPSAMALAILKHTDWNSGGEKDYGVFRPRSTVDPSVCHILEFNESSGIRQGANVEFPVYVAHLKKHSRMAVNGSRYHFGIETAARLGTSIAMVFQLSETIWVLQANFSIPIIALPSMGNAFHLPSSE